MKFRDTLFIAQQMFDIIILATPPTIKALLRSPKLLLSPREVSRIFMATLWVPFAEGMDEHSRPMKVALITPHACGTVLEIGPGFGHTAQYLDCEKVQKYIALEPNTHMHAEIRKKAHAAGFSEEDGTLLLLTAGVESLVTILEQVQPHSVDTLISINSLCSLPATPHPAKALEALCDAVLAPGGGQFLFHEHVLSPIPSVARWQNFWTPIWSRLVDGCRLNRPTHLWIKEMVMWKEGSVWDGESEPEEHLFWRRTGRFVKK